MRALGIHCFAGGITLGVRETPGIEVVGQLEIHDLGAATSEAEGIARYSAPVWQRWPSAKELGGVDAVFGNPRCTGFSSLTGGGHGGGEKCHGPDAACTQDIWDLCLWSAENEIPLVSWESVCGAMSTGRPLLNRLRDTVFGPRGYRLCYVLLSAAAMGSCQRRRRFMFVAYRGGNFNVEPPAMPDRQVTVRDKIFGMYASDRQPMLGERQAGQGEHPDTTNQMSGIVRSIVPSIRPGGSISSLDWENDHELRAKHPHHTELWDTRVSDLPFSLHQPNRLHWDWHAPTMSSSCGSFLHPDEDRYCTIRELAALMGWPRDVLPSGSHKIAQLAKGVCPEVGAWWGQQMLSYHFGSWSDDWSSTYDHHTGQWYGERYEPGAGPLEKTINMKTYEPPNPKYVGEFAIKKETS